MGCRSDFQDNRVGGRGLQAQTGGSPGNTASPVVTVDTSVPNYTAPTVTIGSPDVTGIHYLTGFGTNVGPRLKDAPADSGQHEIAVATDGTGKIQVVSSAGTATIPASGTGTSADCSSVK